MSNIDLDGLPVFDAEYFAKKNAAVIDGGNTTEYWQKLNRQKRSEKKAKEAAAAASGQIVGSVTSQTLSESEIDSIYAREGNYNDIMAFYEWFLFSEEILEELRQEAIFFGGTVPYAVLGTPPETYRWDPRVFGDVDIYIQLKEFKKVRGLLTKLKRFTMTDDSADMFIHRKTDDETATFNEEVYNKLLHKDFGFKGSIDIRSPLMNMMLERKVSISLYPIFSENGNVCSRGFRFGHYYKRKGDYLLDTMLAEDYSLDDFITPARILGKEVNIVTPEYIFESKRIALSKEYKYREDKDKVDIAFMTAHEEALGINHARRRVLERSIPYYGVQTAYRIKNGQVVGELNGHDYVEAVKYERSSFT